MMDKQQESAACPVDARRERNDWLNGSPSGSTQGWPSSSEVSQAQEMTLLLQMHKELLSMIGALIEQNQQTLDAVSQITDDFDGPPTHYMDGSRI